MKALLSCSNVVVARIKRAEHVLLLIDYDGTLTPIVERPELAKLSLQVKECLQNLTENPSLTLGIISGRVLEDLRERVSIKGIIYAGNHGLEIEGPGITYVNPVAKKTKPFICSLCQDISRELADIRGAIIEDKGLTLSLHYRLVDEAQLEELNRIFCNIIKPFVTSGKIKVSEGKRVYEVKPAVDWGKGKAIAFIAQNLKWKREPLMVFFGDDVTDYDGFRTVDDSGGISIYVAGEDTEPVAQYFLDSPEEVYQFLRILSETFKSGGS